MILRTYFFYAIICLALFSCADKLICPAYQSSFIHDKDALRKKFSYFENDSVPKVLTASKTKYLVAVPESYRKRYKKMQTVEMKPIYTIVEDSAEAEIPPNPIAFQKDLDSIALVGIGNPQPIDSTKLAVEDSVYVISKDKEIRILRYNFPDSLKLDSATGRFVKEKPPYYYVDEVGYNAEQENYMWYFRKELILPDARLSKQKKEEKKVEAATVEKKNFFQKLMFWKKDKPKTDSLAISPTNAELDVNAFDPKDSSSVAKPPTKAKKKGLLGMFKKKGDESIAPGKQPIKKEEEEGF